MIENDVNQQKVVSTKTGSVTSPISKSNKKNAEKKENGFIAWLRDNDIVDENNGKIEGSVAVTSFIKGLAEVVKTLYKKPFLSAVTIGAGIFLTYGIGYNALVTVMTCSIVAGAAGILYAGYHLVKPTTSNNTKQAYEVLGISTLVLGIGIYGLNF